ncbi:YybH family protein [Streptomyces sp. YIM B13502]|uniref:YybH family protein n=1 Tax=Streptomyces sp. YIM B13502 TaxID=3366317 RepID=UPI003698C686
MRTLADRPEEVPVVFAERFNSGDAAALAEVYEDAAVLVPQPGTPATGPDLHAANGRLQKLGVPITVRPRHVYRSGDVALLIVDWSSTGPVGRDRPCTSKALLQTSPGGVRTAVGGMSSTTPSAPAHSKCRPRTP